MRAAEYVVVALHPELDHDLIVEQLLDMPTVVEVGVVYGRDRETKRIEVFVREASPESEATSAG